MKKLTLASLMLSAFVLAACSSAPEKPPIEEKPATPAGPVVETHGMAEGAGDQVETLGGGNGMALGVDAAGMAMLRDPNSLLSKRVVYFDYDQSAIKAEYQQIVAAHAAFLQKYPGAHVILQGNTDERGSREYNMSLGQRRADSVQQAMVVLGSAAGQIETISFGEEKPVAEGDGEYAWSLNRRTEIHYQGE